MLRILYIWIMFILLIFVQVSCNKEGAGCFEGAGQVVLEEREGGDITYIEILDDPDVVIIQKSGDRKIMVETGKNLLKGVKTEISGNKLTIRNSNTCNWMRSFETPMKVYVEVGYLDSLVYRGSGDVITENSIVNDSVKVDIWEGSGTLIFDVDVFKSRFYIHEGTADLIVKGSCWINFLSSKAFGPADLGDLNTQFTYMYSSSPNNCFVHAEQVLAVTIDNVGNVYYKGDPQLETVINSSGGLIKIE